MKYLVAIAIGLFCTSNVFANTELKGSPEELRKFLHPQKRTVTLFASAERRVYANQAIVSVLVKNEEKTLARAMSENKALRDDLRKELLAAGIDETNIKNSKFSSSPQYGWFGDEPSSFEVSNRVSVTISSEQALQALANASDKFDEMSIAGTEYKDTNKDAIHQELKKEAMAKVLKDKAYYEQSLNVSLTASSFSDSGLNVGATAGEMDVELIRVTGARKNSADSMSSRYAAEPRPATSFEEILYTTSVQVQFEIGITGN